MNRALSLLNNIDKLIKKRRRRRYYHVYVQDLSPLGMRDFVLDEDPFRYASRHGLALIGFRDITKKEYELVEDNL